MSRLRQALVAAIIACAAPVLSAQSASDLTAELARLRTALGSASVEELPGIASSIPSVWTVTADGQRIDVSTAWITGALEEARKKPGEWPARRAALSTRLDAIAQEIARVSGSADAPPDMERSRAAAATILAREEFQRNPSENALANLRRRITDWLVSMWDRYVGNRFGTERVASAVAWVTALSALVALSWWLIASLLRSTDRAGLSLTAPAARRTSARAWAQQAAAAADPRETVRCAYRATVATLEEEGTWRHDDARTPREHLRLLPVEHRRRPLFADVSRRFEDVWFGARTPTVDDTRAMLVRLQELGWLRAD